jgi:prepilin signal peptidase PulO-like enzyme (type II secretory pathway)
MTLFVAVMLGVFGAVLASFAGVISERLNTGESWLSGRSRCNSCSRTLSASDLMPILSWVLSLGRCRTCKASVPYRYLLAELSLGIAFFAGAELLGLTIPLLFLLVSFFLLAIIVLYDLRHTIVPLNLSLLLVLTSALYAVSRGYDIQALGTVCITAGAIGLGFFLLHVVSGGKWMGLGDAPIALALALLAGHAALPGLLFSFWIGAVIGIIVLVATPKGHRMGIEVPFVPFLAAGYLLALFTQWNPFIL